MGLRDGQMFDRDNGGANDFTSHWGGGSNVNGGGIEPEASPPLAGLFCDVDVWRVIGL